MKRHHRFLITLAALAMPLAGCSEQAPKVTPRYPTLAKKNVPAYLKDTVLEYTDLSGVDPYPISGYGLVANLRGTGSSRAPTAVRDFIIKEMARRGFGSLGSGTQSPEDLLNNKSFAIVRVDAEIPPGARAGTDWWTWFDVHVSALPESDTTSLAHGDLYLTDLKLAGANPLEPGSGNVSVMGQARGPIFVNPAYALDDGATISSANTPTNVKASRRNGVVLGGCRPLDDRPFILRLRQPEQRMARAIEKRVIEQFQSIVDEDRRVKGLAAAQDEGRIYVYLPKAYSQDWVHFVGVLKHIYMQGADPRFAALKAEELAKEAVKPDAPLLDISYAWEGLGSSALGAITPLMTSSVPDVQFAAARAAAFIGDPGAPPVLVNIAATKGNPFRVNAVQALAELPSSPMIDKMLRPLLASDEAMVRIETYKVLAKHGDASVLTIVVGEGDNEKFVLDIVRGAGAPMVYATQQDMPRLVVFGLQTALDLPVIFSAMNNRLSISSTPDNDAVTIFYRGRELDKPIKLVSPPDIAQIVARLGGQGAPGDAKLDFAYADVVAIVQSLIDGKKVSGLCGEQRQLASFVLQEGTSVDEPTDETPLIRDNGRPQADATKPDAEPRAGGDAGLIANGAK